MNKPEILEVVEPEPLEGEVKAGASHPDQEDTVSVTANEKETPAPPTPPAPLAGEVAPGASEPDVQPPSVKGTSYDEE
jgi:hypothetical protein